jgi:hypothetical protein
MNRTVVAVMVALIAVLAIGVAVGGSSKKTPPKSFVAGGSFRAVVVPTDQPRTVVVTPCNAPSSPAASMRTPGATTLRVPAGGGLRTVLVPQCAATKGTQLNGTANTASAAFVLKPGEEPEVPAKPQTAGVLARVVLPTQSAARTIVVSPCRRSAAQREVVLKPRGETVVAPSC